MLLLVSDQGDRLTFLLLRKRVVLLVFMHFGLLVRTPVISTFIRPETARKLSLCSIAVAERLIHYNSLVHL